MIDRFDPKAWRRGPAAVLGLGRSGLQAANLLASKGFKVLVSDARPRSELRAAAAKLKRGVSWEAGGHSDRVLRCRFAVKSPGIASHAPVTERLRKAGVPVFSELEVALAYCRSREVVAVTGTNGKTTTTLLAGAVFKAARRKVRIAGNVGVPAAAVVPQAGARDTVVLEVSSYQLEDSRFFRPRAAVLLNVTADHVDHHGSMSRYVAAKAKVFSHQTKEDSCVFNAADAACLKLSRQCRSRRLYFSLERSSLSHAWVQGGRIRVRLPGRKEAALEPPALPGAHNLENAMAAALLGLERGVPASAVQRAFRSFRGVEHRIEDSGTAGGLRFFNDSKATNVESTLTALRALRGEGPILLILGGLHKGYPYGPLRPFLGDPVKGVLTIGSAAGKIEEDLSGEVPILPCRTLEAAVKTALQVASKGDILLLSPACASFDQFKDYEDRGRQFKDLVKKLAPSLRAPPRGRLAI